MAKRQLTLPVKSQLDNERLPHQTCSYTSMAMVYQYFDPALRSPIVRGGYAQPEDDMSYEFEVSFGYQRGNPHDMAHFWNEHFVEYTGHRDVFVEHGTRALIKDLIDRGTPVIVHGWFTRSGHVLVIIGYDDEAYGGAGAYIVLDPYGECDLASASYQGMPTTVGPHRYSYRRTEELCTVDDTFWLHMFTPTPQEN